MSNLFTSCPNSNVAAGDRVRGRIDTHPSPTYRFGTCMGWERVGGQWQCALKCDGIGHVRFIFKPSHVLRLEQAEQDAA